MCAIYADLHKNVTILMSRVHRDDSLYGGQIDGCVTVADSGDVRREI